MPFSGKEEIEHISELARIKLTSEEKSHYANELSSILNFVDHLQEVDTSGVEPLYQVTGKENVMRKDENPGILESPERDIILKQFPDREGDFNRVKEILIKKD